MYIKEVFVLCLAQIFLHIIPACQTHWQFSLCMGPTLTSDIRYQNSTGHIRTLFTVSPAFTYYPLQTLGIELKYSGMSKALSYLDNKGNETLRQYTTSHIDLYRITTGLNFYLPLKRIKPFFGILAGASYAEEDNYYPNSQTKFNWGFQFGATLNISKLVALRLDGSKIYIPNVFNNSLFWGGYRAGGDSPSYLIGTPSKATIKQLNVNFGLILNMGKTKKRNL